MGREPGGVDRIVEETGGDLVRTNDVGSTFAELLRRLRLRYGLYYRLPEGASGALRVLVLVAATALLNSYPKAIS
jgi:hypothetical protein